jgi:serine/threonine-protein kinase PpkA
MRTPAAQPVAGFRVERRLAQASIGELHLATRERDGLPVVLKLLHVAGRTRREHLACVVHEYELVSRIAHPHVIHVHEAGSTGEHAYIAMEYLARGDLRREIARGMQRERVLQVLRQLASALEAIHAGGIIHRDLKPGNVLLRDDGAAVLADFGIARSMLQEEDIALALAGQREAMLGTPFYVSPEQAEGAPATPASDLYSLGVLLYEMLTGERPYRGDSLRALLDAHRQAPVPQLPEATRELQPLLDRLMAKQARQRYATARALLADLA